MTLSRKKRREQLVALLEADPFLTDQQLAVNLDVSVATIRLDRMALAIPEMRERTREMAAKHQEKLKALEGFEVIGELIDLEIGKHGISILSVTNEMTFKKTNILRGHYLFAQGNSLAVSLIDAEVVLTKSAKVSYISPVRNDERVVCKAVLIKKELSHHTISVESKVDQNTVFTGEFVVVSVKESGSN